MKKLLPAIALCISIIASCKKEPVPPAAEELYFPKVKTIIEANCLSCHSPGGQGMPVILTIDSNIVNLAATIKSATIDPVSPMNKRMPQGGELSDADKDIILQWFEAGGRATD